jgi:hypothetical protein
MDQAAFPTGLGITEQGPSGELPVRATTLPGELAPESGLLLSQGARCCSPGSLLSGVGYCSPGKRAAAPLELAV